MRRLKVVSIILAVAMLFSLGVSGIVSAQGPSEEARQRYIWLLTSPGRRMLSAAGERALLQLTGVLHVPTTGPTLEGGEPSVLETFDVQVNDPAEDPGDQTTQSEVSVAVSGLNVVTGYNDSAECCTSGATKFSGYSFSNDGGLIWFDGGGIPALPGGDTFGDPSLGTDSVGNFYYAGLGSTSNGISTINVSRSVDGGGNFGTPVRADTAGKSVDFDDKEHLAVGPDPNQPRDNIYVSWTLFPFPFNRTELYVSRSIDGGASFDGAVLVGKNGQGTNLAVDPTGRVYVAWQDFERSPTRILISRSDDGGQSFGKRGAPGKVVIGEVNFIGDAVADCGNSNRRVIVTGNTQHVRTNEFPVIAVDPATNNVYATWNSSSSATFGTGVSEILFSRSTDGGRTWSPPVQVDQLGGTHNFHPWMVADSNGVHIFWSGLNADGTINKILATSTDGGLTWPLANQQVVNTVPFPVVQTNPNFDPVVVDCYMAEYHGIASDEVDLYLGWGDNRNTVVTEDFPDGRRDPDVFFAIVTVSPVPGITVTPTSGLITTEAAGTDTFTVVLDTLPSNVVTIDLSSSDTSEGTVSPASLIFTPGNGTTPQTVAVTGVDDDVVDGDVAYTIVTAAATSADPDYNGIDPADVSVTNIDDDTPPPSTDIHVGDLDAMSQKLAKGEWSATVTVTVHNDGEDGVAGARVTGEFQQNGVAPFTRECMTLTGVNGTCIVGSGPFPSKKGNASFTVTNVQGSIYNSSKNHDPDGDSNGTTINISK